MASAAAFQPSRHWQPQSATGTAQSEGCVHTVPTSSTLLDSVHSLPCLLQAEAAAIEGAASAGWHCKPLTRTVALPHKLPLPQAPPCWQGQPPSAGCNHSHHLRGAVRQVGNREVCEAVPRSVKLCRHECIWQSEGAGPHCIHTSCQTHCASSCSAAHPALNRS